MQVRHRCVAVAVAAGLSLLSSVVAAEEKAKAPVGSGPNPYRDCGIGAALFPNTTWAAVTSNAIWDVGTTAITSATASPETCSGASAKVAQFVANTYVAVVDETARGQGEHLTAVLGLYGCTVTEHPVIVADVRSVIGERIASAEFASLSDHERSEQFFLALDGRVRAHHAEHCTL